MKQIERSRKWKLERLDRLEVIRKHEEHLQIHTRRRHPLGIQSIQLKRALSGLQQGV